MDKIYLKNFHLFKSILVCFIHLYFSNILFGSENERQGNDNKLYYYTIYINPDNSADANQDGSINHPFDTWDDVEWNKKTRILLKKGTIIKVDKVLVLSDDIYIGSYGQGSNKPIINSISKTSTIKIIEKKNIHVKNIEVNAPNSFSSIEFINCSNSIIENCDFSNSQIGIKISLGNNFILRYNKISHKKCAVLANAEDIAISYNIFCENQMGISVNNLRSSVEIFNNVFYSNRIAIDSEFGELLLYNNIFYLENQGDQAINKKLGRLISDYNIFYPEQEGFINIADNRYQSLEEYQDYYELDLKSFSADPKFIDIYSDNFKLSYSSPGIDAGKSVGITEDYYGIEIPQGTHPDIGIYEYDTEKIYSIATIDSLEIIDSSTLLMKKSIIDLPSSIYLDEIREIILPLSYDFVQNKSENYIMNFISRNTIIGEIEIDQIPYTVNIEIDLNGFGFDILEGSPAFKFLRAGESKNWVWDIKAIDPGSQLLKLNIIADLEMDDENIQKKVTSYRQEVTVEVTMLKRVKIFLLEHIEWIVTSILTLVCGFYLGKYKRKVSVE